MIEARIGHGVWTRTTSVLVLPAVGTYQREVDAVHLIQSHLRGMYGVETGFDIMKYGAFLKRPDKDKAFVLATDLDLAGIDSPGLTSVISWASDMPTALWTGTLAGR